MTRTTNTRIAGSAYLFYMAVGLSNEALMARATSGEGPAAQLARIAEHATDVQISMLLTLLECFAAVVLGVSLYGVTREQDHELAVLAMLCRVAEGIINTAGISGDHQLLWLANTPAGAPHGATPNALRAVPL